MNQPNLLSFPAPLPAPAPKRRSLAFNPKEFKVVALRECPTPAEMRIIDTPERVLGYWHDHVVTHPYYSPDVECFVALMLNTRRRILGHHLVSTGTMDTLLCHPVNVFRAPIVISAAAIILTHNHPRALYRFPFYAAWFAICPGLSRVNRSPCRHKTEDAL